MKIYNTKTRNFNTKKEENQRENNEEKSKVNEVIFSKLRQKIGQKLVLHYI